jgi:hypothetical protein
MPKVGSIEVDNKYYRYFYLIKGTVQYLLYEFIWAKLQQNNADRYRGSIEQHFIIFEDSNQAQEFQYTVEQQKEAISRALDAERASPENAHLGSRGFYYGFNELDKTDYTDSRFFFSKFIEFTDQ